jgi:hypothetical protein
MNKLMLAALGLAAVPATVPAQPLDFMQIDAGRRTATLVAVKALRGMVTHPAPAPLVSGVYTDFSTGNAASVAYTHRWAVAQGTYGFVSASASAPTAFAARTHRRTMNRAFRSGRRPSRTVRRWPARTTRSYRRRHSGTHGLRCCSTHRRSGRSPSRSRASSRSPIRRPRPRCVFRPASTAGSSASASSAPRRSTARSSA